MQESIHVELLIVQEQLNLQLFLKLKVSNIYFINKSNLYIQLYYLGKDEIDKSSQYPDSLKYIEKLEDYSKYQRSDSYEEIQPLPPTFVRSLHNMGDLQEGRNAHFEAQLNPVSDPTMKVEWYKDGKPITASMLLFFSEQYYIIKVTF